MPIEMLTGQQLNQTQSTDPDIAAKVAVTIEDQFTYHKPTEDQIISMNAVRETLAEASKIIVAMVPPSADRSVALRKLREARMDANSAIIHNGKY